LRPYIALVEAVRSASVLTCSLRNHREFDYSLAVRHLIVAPDNIPKNERRHGNAPRHTDQHENPF